MAKKTRSSKKSGLSTKKMEKIGAFAVYGAFFAGIAAIIMSPPKPVKPVVKEPEEEKEGFMSMNYLGKFLGLSNENSKKETFGARARGRGGGNQNPVVSLDDFLSGFQNFNVTCRGHVNPAPE